jgi:RNA polymerase sigma-70 factor (ECF subfamily)
MKRDILSAKQGEPLRDADPDEPAAPATLYGRWRQPLLRLFQRRTGKRAQAEDAAQDVFVRLALLGKLRVPDEEESFLRTAVYGGPMESRCWRGRDTGPRTVPMEALSEETASLQAQE